MQSRILRLQQLVCLKRRDAGTGTDAWDHEREQYIHCDVPTCPHNDTDISYKI
jgi:hypothetical protein